MIYHIYRITCSVKQEEALNDAKAKDGDSNQGRKLAHLDKTVYLYIYLFLFKILCNSETN